MTELTTAAEIATAMTAETSQVKAPFLMGPLGDRPGDRVQVPSEAERVDCWAGQVVTVHAVHPVFGGVRVEARDSAGLPVEFTVGRDVFVTVTW